MRGLQGMTCRRASRGPRDDRLRPDARLVAGVRAERGQVVVLFALLLPIFFLIGAIVIAIGSWFVHARNLQTKVDAAALAGGSVWGFPCGSDIDASIEGETRKYFGDHTTADGRVIAGSFNPQVGQVGAAQIFVALNQSSWWSGSFATGDFSDPLGSVCESKTLDVKATESDSPLLWSLIPLFPDIKRKARVEIQEAEGLSGLLPVAVRLPQPQSAAAVFYNEANGTILDVRLFREVCTPSVAQCIVGVPQGLGQWTTEPDPADVSGTWAQFHVAATTGAVVATSFRPACGTGTPPADQPCLEDSGWAGQPINTFCRQASGAVQCYDADGSGSSQNVVSGVHFIRGHGTTDTETGHPQLRHVRLESVNPSSCGAYFNSILIACPTRLTVDVDLGALLGSYPPPAGTTGPLKASDVQVRYRQVRADGTSSCNYGVNCDLVASSPNATGVVSFSTAGTSFSPHLAVTPKSRGNAVALEVRIRNSTNASDPDCGASYSDNCRWYWTGNGLFSDSTPPTDAEILAAPIQRSFMGDIDQTGALRWLRLTVDLDCNPATLTDRIIGADPVSGDDAASQPAGSLRCYAVDLGMAGGMARDQDEQPIALNLGTGSSQRALIDCDPSIANLKSEIVTGCQWPSYATNRFDTSPLCPGTAGFFVVPKADPFASWPPFRCVLTQTSANPQQIIQGFNERLYGVSNNPRCPADVPMSDPTFQWGRNYWHRDNNTSNDEITFAWDGRGPPDATAKGNTLSERDPRLVTLFFTTYDSFASPGNEVYPIVGFGNFYVTGYGTTQNGGWQGGAPDDPCTGGNDGNLVNGNGNEPPPDLDTSRNTTWVWGHFVKDVTPAPFTTGSGALCNPTASFMPCVAVLVE